MPATVTVKNAVVSLSTIQGPYYATFRKRYDMVSLFVLKNLRRRSSCDVLHNNPPD